MNALLERNKVINLQINSHVKKSSTFIPGCLVIAGNKSSGDERN
jgi:hypothetical protein